MKLDRCGRCGEWQWDGRCDCREYWVAVEEWDVTSDWANGRRIDGTERFSFGLEFARNAIEAATRYVERRDSHYDVCDAPVHVLVVDDVAAGDSERTVLRFAVRAEVVVEYSAQLAGPGRGVGGRRFRALAGLTVRATIRGGSH